MVFSFTMNNWNQTPLFRLLPFFIAGIILYLFADLPELSVGAVALFVLLSSIPLAVFLLRRHRPFSKRWIYGLGAYAFSFLSGWLLTALHCEIRRPHHFSRDTSRNFICKIIDIVKAGFAGLHDRWILIRHSRLIA